MYLSQLRPPDSAIIDLSRPLMMNGAKALTHCRGGKHQTPPQNNIMQPRAATAPQELERCIRDGAVLWPLYRAEAGLYMHRLKGDRGTQRSPVGSTLALLWNRQCQLRVALCCVLHMLSCVCCVLHAA